MLLHVGSLYSSKFVLTAKILWNKSCRYKRGFSVFYHVGGQDGIIYARVMMWRDCPVVQSIFLYV